MFFQRVSLKELRWIWYTYFHSSFLQFVCQNLYFIIKMSFKMKFSVNVTFMHYFLFKIYLKDSVKMLFGVFFKTKKKCKCIYKALIRYSLYLILSWHFIYKYLYKQFCSRFDILIYVWCFQICMSHNGNKANLFSYELAFFL